MTSSHEGQIGLGEWCGLEPASYCRQSLTPRVVVIGRPVDGRADKPRAGVLAAYVGRTAALDLLVRTIQSRGLAAVEGQLKSKWNLTAWRRTARLRGRRAARVPIVLHYENRTIATFLVEPDGADPHVVALPYLGERLDERLFQWNAPVGSDAEDALALVIVLSPPTPSPLECSIQRRLPSVLHQGGTCDRNDATYHPYFTRVGEWAAGNWLVRAAETPSQSVSPHTASAWTLSPSECPDPNGRVEDLLALRTRLVREDRLRS